MAKAKKGNYIEEEYTRSEIVNMREPRTPQRKAELAVKHNNYPWLKKYVKGQIANPKGRPKGKTMKEFMREYFMALPEDQKAKFIKALDPEFVWRMAEGNPKQDNDVNANTTLNIVFDNEFSTHDDDVKQISY